MQERAYQFRESDRTTLITPVGARQLYPKIQGSALAFVMSIFWPHQGSHHICAKSRKYPSSVYWIVEICTLLSLYTIHWDGRRGALPKSALRSNKYRPVYHAALQPKAVWYICVKVDCGFRLIYVIGLVCVFFQKLHCSMVAADDMNNSAALC